MVVLHTETLKKWGGQQNRVLTEAVELNKRGHKAIIACHRGSMLSKRAKDAGIKVYEVNMVKQAYPITVFKLIKIIQKEKVDIVATHSSVDSWAGGLAALFTGRILVRFKHNIYRVKSDLPTKFIYTRPDCFITVNETARKVLITTGFIRPEKIKRVYGAIDDKKFSSDRFTPKDREKFRKEMGLPLNSIIVGNTSGFTKVKGQHYLIEALNRLFQSYHNLYAVLAGRLGKKEKVNNLVNPEFKSRIVLPGLYENVPLLLYSIDVFVFPSTEEAFGNSLIEAMAMEKPVLVSDIPSFREFMTDGKDGIFFEKANITSLEQKLSFILNNRKIWSDLGKNARKTVTEKFQPESCVKRWL